MIDKVFDTSAVLAYFNQEPGAERVKNELIGSPCISAANLAEVAGYFILRGKSLKDAKSLVNKLDLIIEPVDERLALAAAALVEHTKKYGLSLGDRICLALAAQLKVPVFTTDKIWVKVANEAKVNVTLIR